jgi:excisionase family DNA binding protein
MRAASAESPDDWLLPSAAARVAECSAAAVRLWIRAGKLPALKLSGGVHAIRREDLDAFLAKGRRGVGRAGARAGESSMP